MVNRKKAKQTDFMISQSTFVRVVLTLVAAVFISTCANAADSDTPQYYELRVYTTKSEAQQERINDYWQQAGVPAYNRLGIKPIGVFTETQSSATNKIYVVIPHNALEGFSVVSEKLSADAEYQKLAGDFLNAPKNDPAYESMQTSLLVAFDGMKHLNPPSTDKKPEVFELRTYISSSEAKGLNKIKMFESGEIDVMKEVGLAPIFYGRTLSGPVMPSLVYMTCGEDADAHRRHWSAFNAAPVWKQLQADPQYKDNMTTMIRVILKRTSASQL